MHGRSILLIDDDRNATEMMRLLLARAGFKGAVTALDHAPAAFAFITEAMAASNPPGIVVVDLSLPEVHGFDTVREIRRRMPASFIVVMSASDHPEDIDAAFSVGADAYFEKFPPVDKLTRIREALEHSPQLPPVLRVVLRTQNSRL